MGTDLSSNSPSGRGQSARPGSSTKRHATDPKAVTASSVMPQEPRGRHAQHGNICSYGPATVGVVSRHRSWATRGALPQYLQRKSRPGSGAAASPGRLLPCAAIPRGRSADTVPGAREASAAGATWVGSSSQERRHRPRCFQPTQTSVVAEVTCPLVAGSTSRRACCPPPLLRINLRDSLLTPARLGASPGMPTRLLPRTG